MDPFRRFYTEQCDRLYGYLARKSGNCALAADLVQESFARCWERYRHRELTVALLFAVGRNLLYDHARRSRRETPMAEPPQQQAMDEEQAYIQREESRLMLDALQRLDEEDRDLLSLVASGSLNYKEIAELCHLNESAVKVRVHRARHKLRQLLAKEHE